MTKQVFKYQASQFPYHVDVMVYNESRKVQGHFPMTPELEALFQKHGEKFYAEGYYDGNTKKVILGKIIESQPW